MEFSGNFTESIISFSLDLFKKVSEDGPEKNAFLSPSSVLLVMAMTQLGAAGNTLQQMTSTLNLNMGQTNSLNSVQKILEMMKASDGNVTLSMTSRLYPGSEILKSYQNMVNEVFLTDVQKMDFAKNPEACRITINGWVETETRGKIKDILAPGAVTFNTAMVVVNAIYFKGNWAQQFNKEDTFLGEFYTGSGNKVSVDMMTNTLEEVKFGINDELSCKVLQLPYEGESLSMIIILPDKVDGLSALEQRLDMKTLNGLISNAGRSSEVLVSLPKFKLEATYSLGEMLSELGMPDVFSNKADFSKMSSARLFVSHLAHKAFIQTDEEGTEAAAATAAIVMLSSDIYTPSFHADHPFMFMIWDSRSRIPLFIGRYTNPEPNKDLLQDHDEL